MTHSKNKQKKLSKEEIKVKFDKPFFKRSWLEEQFYNLLREKKLLNFVEQYNVGKYYIDFAFLDEKVAVEVNGKKVHGKPDRIKKDAIKKAYLEINGWKVLVFNSDQVKQESGKCIKELKSVLKQLRHNGSLNKWIEK